MKKEDSKIFVRILAIVLAVLMVVGIAYLTVYMIVDHVKEKKKDSAAAFSPRIAVCETVSVHY